MKKTSVESSSLEPETCHPNFSKSYAFRPTTIHHYDNETEKKGGAGITYEPGG